MISTNNKALYRKLSDIEIEALKDRGNSSDNWENITVKEGFDPIRINNSTFIGNIQIGIFTDKVLLNENLKLPTGIYNSMIVSSAVGDNCAVHNAKYIEHYNIENNVLIFNIDELFISENPLFGHGYLKEDGSRNKIALINENGNRSILPFKGIKTADAYLWSKYRGNSELIDMFRRFTDNLQDSAKNYNSSAMGHIGSFSVLRSCRIIKDVNFGDYSRISGISRLENLTIDSTEENPSVIGEDSDLENGIIGYGTTIRHGVKASNFILGNFSNLKYGARFFDSYLAENSAIACCEVQNSLLFPFHEQHHNNSFLIASCLQGQSNIAAGSTIGSNHNSRGADGEIYANRGFWTALSSSLKHNSKFASFTLLGKNDFQYEMDIRLPFSLVSLDPGTMHLQIMPAYWFVYNMYALTRNSWKFSKRDKRTDKTIIFENDYLAPDTIEEILDGLDVLEEWLEESRKQHLELIEIEAGIVEHSKTKVHILKPVKAYNTYKSIVNYYSAKVLCEYADTNNIDEKTLISEFRNDKRENWINIGGQLIRQIDFTILTNDVINGSIASWDDMHKRYLELNSEYRRNKASHAFTVIKSIYHIDTIDLKTWNVVLNEAKTMNRQILDNCRQSRLKDYTNYFRNITFGSKEESLAVLGNIEEDSFIGNVSDSTDELENLINKYISKEDN